MNIIITALNFNRSINNHNELFMKRLANTIILKFPSNRFSYNLEESIILD